MSLTAADRAGFYEHYVEEHVPYHLSPRGTKKVVLSFLPYWSYREWKFWSRWVPSGCRLLDLGCARGREIFRERAAFACGVDLARTALRDCAGRYDGALAADLTALPHPDQSFDCVVSSHVLGHVPPDEKDAVLAEIFRVLRPAGMSLHVIETDSLCPWIRCAKEHPGLYQRYLVDQDGHVGLELASKVLSRFEEAGLPSVALEVLGDGDLHPRLALKWFDNEYREVSPQLEALVRRSESILRSPLRLAVREVRLGARGRSPSDAEALDQALFVAIALRKPADSS